MRQLIFIDYLVIAAYVALSFAIGNYYVRRAGSSLDEYFVSGRKTPWWLIGLSMAATKNQWYILLFFIAVTLAYTMLGGLSAVIMTDSLQYVFIIVSAVILAIFSVSYVGGLDMMISKINVLFAGKNYLNFMPSIQIKDGHSLMPWSAFLVYLFIQWWANKYSDGGGKHIQRMSAAKNETHSVAGTFMYSVFYIMSTWPIILVALCSLIVFKDLKDPEYGYPMMMTTILPNGLLGLCIVGLLSAFMSTVSTHLNLGASYLVNDIYKAFFVKNAKEKHYILLSRFATVLIALISLLLSVYIESIADTWQFVLSFASGAGIVWILRWFWWRINAYSEFSSMIFSAIVASYLKLFHPQIPYTSALFITVVSTIPVFLLVTYITAPVSDETLKDFYSKVRPSSWGWSRIADKYNIKGEHLQIRSLITNFILGTLLLFLINFGIGTFILRSVWLGTAEFFVGLLVAFLLIKRIQNEGAAKKIEIKNEDESKAQFCLLSEEKSYGGVQ